MKVWFQAVQHHTSSHSSAADSDLPTWGKVRQAIGAAHKNLVTIYRKKQKKTPLHVRTTAVLCR